FQLRTAPVYTAFICFIGDERHTRSYNYSLQDAVEITPIETRIKVSELEDPEPSINLYVENQADPTMRLVSEMMVLFGEAIATF
ncbi:hypothetical protein RYX36_017558, partial [Vicia faba]